MKRLFVLFLISFFSGGGTAWPLVSALAFGKNQKKSPFYPLIPQSVAAETPNTSVSAPAGFTVSKREGLMTSENGTTDSFTVVLNKKPTANVILNILSSDTQEITVTPSELVFTPDDWSAAKQVVLTGINDGPAIDGNKSVRIILGQGISSDSEYNSLSAGEVSATNVDNDSAGIAVSQMSNLNTSESGDSDTFTVALSSAPTANVVLTLVSNNTAEGTVSPTTLTFTPSNYSTPQTVTVTGADDGTADGNIPYTVSITNAASSDLAYNGLSVPNISVTNFDNDTPWVFIDDTVLTTYEQPGTAKTYRVKLLKAPTANVTVSMVSNDTTEGTVSPASLTFTPGNYSSFQTVTVTPVYESAIDGDITYTVRNTPSSADLNYNALLPVDVTVTNVDAVPGFEISAVSGATDEFAATATFQIRLKAPPSSDVTLNLTSSNPLEGVIQSGSSLTFTSANWSIFQTVIVRGVDDSIKDPNKGYTIITSPAVSADSAYSGMNPSDIDLVNGDNDTPGYTVSTTSVSQNEGGTQTFTIRLASRPTANVTVNLSSANTSIATVSPASITFTALSWSTMQTVTVTMVDNFADTANNGTSILISNAVSTDPNYSGLFSTAVTATSVDNDTRGVTLANNTSKFMFDSLSSTESFTVKLNSQPTADVIYDVTSLDTSKLTASPSTLTFTPANWNTAQTVTLTGAGNPDINAADANVTVRVGDALNRPQSGLSDYNLTTAGNVSVNVCDLDGGYRVAVCRPSGAFTTVFNENGGTSSQFILGISDVPTANVTTTITSSDTTECNNMGTVTFTPASRISGKLSVSAFNDVILDGNQTCTMTASNTASTDNNFNNLAVTLPATLFTVTDNEVPNINSSPNNLSTGARLTVRTSSVNTFNVTLTFAPAANVTYNLSVGAGCTGSSVSPASMTFTSANWNSPQTVTFTAGTNSGNCQIITGNFSSADPVWNGTNPSDFYFNVQSPGVTVTLPTGSAPYLTSEIGTTQTFQVRLNSAPSSNVTIAVSSSNTAEGTVSVSSLTFTPANWSTNQTVTVTGADESVFDGDQNYQIFLSNTSSADAGYNGVSFSNQTINFRNIDND
ncbi:MAG TPA: hypothetical protein PK683_01415 [Leptospiraceae bacterium]|nr:hypothetical protein [Leptospiraceae bacterium]